MKHFDDLPKRDSNHSVGSLAEAAFQNLIAETSDFIIQFSDRTDYGTDYQIEVIDRGVATNVRLHVQLKGTEQDLNADGMLSVSVARTNLNYLLMHPYSFYVAYHIPTKELRIRYAEDVLRSYEDDGTRWREQKTLTVSFEETLTQQGLAKLAGLAKSSAILVRNNRISQSTAGIENLGAIISDILPELHVPRNELDAVGLLTKLHDLGSAMVISASFDKFLAVLGPAHDAMIYCHMAEIDIAMERYDGDRVRIDAAIGFMRSHLHQGRFGGGGLHYSIANGLSAVGNNLEAVVEYEASLLTLASGDDEQLRAQVLKNLGTSLLLLGKEKQGVECFTEALRLSPDLAEAHHALGCHHHRFGRYETALDHFDKVVFLEGSRSRISSVSGYRINIHFNLGDYRAAFREINVILGDAGRVPWIWPWCASQVTRFGRESVESAKLGGAFWRKYLLAHPGHEDAKRQTLLSILFLRSRGQEVDITFERFHDELEANLRTADTSSAAFLWDRLGHWAQDNGRWKDAERCFRKAYDLGGGEYGYCLGTALNHLGRFEESLPILLQQAEDVQPDEMSWLQVAEAYLNLGSADEAIQSYRKALVLNPQYDLALFNLGGLLWNEGEVDQATALWRQAVSLYPEHELTATIRSDFSFLGI